MATARDREESWTLEPAEYLRHVHIGQQKALWQSINLATKGMAFYLAITAALVGYVLTQSLDDTVRAVLLAAAIAISMLYFIAFGATAWGILRQLRAIEAVTTALNPTVWHDLAALRVVSRMRRVVRIVVICSFLVGGVLVGGLCFLLSRGTGAP